MKMMMIVIVMIHMTTSCKCNQKSQGIIKRMFVEHTHSAASIRVAGHLIVLMLWDWGLLDVIANSNSTQFCKVNLKCYREQDSKMANVQLKVWFKRSLWQDQVYNHNVYLHLTIFIAKAVHTNTGKSLLETSYS